MSNVYVRKDLYRKIVMKGLDVKEYVNDLISKELKKLEEKE
jgi:post-segregation antitoxin (ccd killing protein)